MPSRLDPVSLTLWLFSIYLSCALGITMLANSRVSAAQQEPDATRPNAARLSPGERVAAPPVREMEELKKRFAQARAEKEAGDFPAAARANEKLIALGLRKRGKLRMVKNPYPEASDFYRRS